MVDSLIFRINDLFENRDLVEFLGSLPDGKKIIDKALDDPYDVTKEIYLQRYYVDMAKGTDFAQGYNGFVRSQHYNCAFYINYNRGFIEFNLSLPKFFYGNNILQLVDHHFDPNYHYFKNWDFWETKTLSFQRFVQVLNLFFEKDLLGKVNKSFVEILRIDICFNLVFRSKDDAMYYLTELKSVRRKRWSPTSNVITNYYSGMYYPSKDFTVKIYHKGTEFKAPMPGKPSNYSQVKKKQGKQVADKILGLADCMLRYEVEFRRGYMTEVFYSLLKEKRKDLYVCLKYSRQNSGQRKISEKGVNYNFDGMNNAGEFVNGLGKISPQQKADLAVGDFIRKKDLRFPIRMNLDRSLMSLPKAEVLTAYDHIEEFNYDLYSKLIDKFKVIFMHFQLGCFDNLNALSMFMAKRKEDLFKRKIAAMGKQTSLYDGVSEGKLRWLIELLLDNSWDQIREKKLLPERTLRRYKKVCDEIGLKEKNLNYNFSVKYDYSNYFELVMRDFDVISQRKMF